MESPTLSLTIMVNMNWARQPVCAEVCYAELTVAAAAADPSHRYSQVVIVASVCCIVAAKWSVTAELRSTEHLTPAYNTADGRNMEWYGALPDVKITYNRFSQFALFCRVTIFTVTVVVLSRGHNYAQARSNKHENCELVRARIVDVTTVLCT